MSTMSDSSQSKKRSEIWKDFYENSTLHGLRNIFASEKLHLRIIWLVFLLGFTGYIVCSMIISFNRFYEYPSIIEVDVKTKRSLPYPAITICPLNFLDNYKAKAKDGDHVFKDYQLNISACAATADLRGEVPCGHSMMCAFMDHPAFKYQRLPNCTDEHKRAISQALDKANIIFDTMEFLRTFAETWSEIMLNCAFGQTYRECISPRYYKAIASYKGGLCHTFNDEIFQDVPIESDATGSFGGVTFFLKHRPERYFFPIYAEGFQVFIHDQNTGLGATEILAPPGKIIKLDKSEGGQCEKKILQGFKRYTQKDCIMECVSNATKDACGCRETRPGEYNDATTCNSRHIECIDKMHESFQYEKCQCPLSCDETIYKTSVSYASLPRRSIPGVNEMYPLPDYSPENYAAVTVYFNSHRDVTLRQKRTFGPTSLLGEIGGNIGLLLGCSLMTIVEFIFLLVSLTATFLKPKGPVRDAQPGQTY